LPRKKRQFQESNDAIRKMEQEYDAKLAAMKDEYNLENRKKVN
jgi:hypothetical protein